MDMDLEVIQMTSIQSKSYLTENQMENVLHQLIDIAPQSGILDFFGGGEIKLSDPFPIYSFNPLSSLSSVAYETKLTFSETVFIPIGIDTNLAASTIVSLSNVQLIEIIDSEAAKLLSDKLLQLNEAGFSIGEHRLIRIPEFGYWGLWIYRGSEIEDRFVTLAPKDIVDKDLILITFSQLNELSNKLAMEFGILD
jgi:hypothetical protein